MEERTLNALEFPKVLGHLAKRCSSEAGKEAALSLRPLEDFDAVFRRQRLGGNANLVSAGKEPLAFVS